MQSGNIPVYYWGCTGNKMKDRSSNVSNRGHSLNTALILRSPSHLTAANTPQTEALPVWSTLSNPDKWAEGSLHLPYRLKSALWCAGIQDKVHLYSLGPHMSSCSLLQRTSRGKCESSVRVESCFYANPSLTTRANRNHRVIMETTEHQDRWKPTECTSYHYHSGKHRLNAFTALWATLEEKPRQFGSKCESISLPNNLQGLFQMTASWRDQARVAFKIVHNVSWPHCSCAL